jgi:hypothetical protein
MKLLINTSQEIRELSGTFAANINFERIRTDVQLESEKIYDLIGQALTDKVMAIADSLTPSDDEKTLLQAIKLPIAIGASYIYYQSNNLSHDDNGRKAKLNKDHESQAWEWQINKDDEAALRKHRNSIDRLIKYLDKKNITEWIESDNRKKSRELFLNNTEAFNQYIYIDGSPSFYYNIQSLIKESQIKHIKPVLGTDYEPYLEAFKAGSTSGKMEDEFPFIQSALALHTMSLAVKRMAIQIMPDGVVQNYRSYAQSLTSSNVAEMPAIEWFSRYLQRDATKALDDLKKVRSQSTAEAPLIPNNSPKNKFART